MAKKELVHYNLDAIDSKGANINIIYGERSNGKSYQVKHKKAINQYLFNHDRFISSYLNKDEVIKKAFDKGSRFMLIRRLGEEIKPAQIEQYFQDVDVVKLTDGKYNCISVYRRIIYLSNYNIEEAKMKRGEKIGYVVALSTEQNYAGASYLDVTDMIFEEFMARGAYLSNEPDKLMNLYCTVDRKRGTTKLWLVGNSISRVCPYIYDWDLHEIFSKLKQGEIETKWLPTGEEDDDGKKIEVKVAIEYCKSTGKSSFVFGKHAEMLNKGAWQSDPQPHLPKSKKYYKIIYRIVFQYQNFRFIAEYLQDKENPNLKCWFVYPKYTEVKKNTIVISDEVRIDRLWQRDIYNLTIKNERLQNLFQSFRENNIFYATDLCGTDFKQVIDFSLRR